MFFISKLLSENRSCNKITLALDSVAQLQVPFSQQHLKKFIFLGKTTSNPPLQYGFSDNNLLLDLHVRWCSSGLLDQ